VPLDARAIEFSSVQPRVTLDGAPRSEERSEASTAGVGLSRVTRGEVCLSG